MCALQTNLSGFAVVGMAIIGAAIIAVTIWPAKTFHPGLK